MRVEQPSAALFGPPYGRHHGGERGQRAQVVADRTGVGWTVGEGRTPEQFQVEVLGVMRDAYPGRDLIVVRTSGDVIERHGGVWYGTSGSPVYVDDKLIGAISFGLTYGASDVVGLTPAEEMAAVMNQLGGISSVWTIWERLPPGNSQLFNGSYTPLFLIGYLAASTLSYNGGTWNLAARYIGAPSPESARRSAQLRGLPLAAAQSAVEPARRTRLQTDNLAASRTIDSAARAAR